MNPAEKANGRDRCPRPTIAGVIPALAAAPPSSLTLDFLAELRLRGFEGDLTASEADRTVFATDNSIYQVVPQAIAFPRNEADVVRIARVAGEPRFAKLSITPRGGGTGTNGQSLTEGVVVDLSRHMNRILSIDPAGRSAWVQAGVVKDHLNDAVREHGLFFAPELSPSNRATLGGMIATDASGQGSVLYGKTRDHVLELKCVMLDGSEWHSKPLAPLELEAVKARDDRIGAVHRLLDRIATDDAALIEARFPKLNRCVTGYDLVHLRDGDGRFNLNSVICGAEGTLAFVTGALVNLVPFPKHSAVVNIRYATFDAALRDARVLMQLEAASSETLDPMVLSLARGDAIWLKVATYFPDDAAGPAQGVNLVEFLADDAAALEAKLARVEAVLAAGDASSGRRGYTVARDEGAIDAIWSMRKKSVGLLGNMPGERRPVPFVEDTVVPPENLADYIAEFRALLDRRKLTYAMFGHVDAGCLHVRPALDMKDPDDERLVREITDELYALTGKYKGVLWGEHGKGVRSEYAPDFFGPLYPRMQEIKAAFDPHNQLNPGKIAAPPGHSLLRIDGVATRGQRDRLTPIAIRAANQDSLHCNGNAACFNYDPDDAMCPSWKATRERRHSPKGRASLMREWLRRLGDAGVDPTGQAPAAWPRRALNSLRGGDDFSHGVKEAMDGCLACKSCVGQCPIKVDVPAFRARFLEAYHGRYLRRPRDRMVTMLEGLLPWLARAPRLANALVTGGPGGALLRGLGLVNLPALPATRLARMAVERGFREASREALSRVPEAERARHVVLVQDAFTSHYEPQVVLEMLELMRRLGFTPWIAPFRPNGKPRHVLGMLAGFERAARANAATLAALQAFGIELVGLDPSMTLTYRAEYAKALGTDDAPAVLLPQEWLARHLDAVPAMSPDARPWRLLPHCTERTNAPASLADWKRVFERFGLEVGMPPSGCCGMAGLYGHLAEQRATSEAIYAQSWRAHVARDGERLMATGYSCRSQASLVDGAGLAHPVQVLLARLNRA
jgi:FAD/FMN-containing dehydrogenase/Fe-S oxidoreductase